MESFDSRYLGFFSVNSITGRVSFNLNIFVMKSFTFAGFALFFLIFASVGLRVKAQSIFSDTSNEKAHSNKRSLTYYDSRGTGGTLFAVPRDYSVESEVSRLELRERDALYNRDTVALKQLWATDFSIGNFRGNKVLPESSSSGLPYYAVFIRMVESVTLVDGLVYVHGVDNTSLIDLHKSSVQPAPHKFTHVWKMFGSSWKMILKFPSDY